MNRLFFPFAAPFLLLLLVSPSAAAPQRARIDPRVVEDTADNQTGRFLVILKPQADRRIFARPGLARVDRRRAALNSLRQAAEGTQPPVRAELERLGAKYHAYWIVNLFAVEGTRAVVDALAARSDVAAIEPDRIFRVELEEAEGAPRAAMGIEWNIDKIGAPAVWAWGVTGQGVVYANADTGVMWSHPALFSHYRGWNGTTADHNYSWWDAVHEDLSGNGANPCNPGGFGHLANSGSLVACDDDGHGTHTTGIGVGDDGLGNQIGVAPGAKWIACRNMEEGIGRPSMYLECFQFFLAPTGLNGQNPDPSKSPDVVGNSYGCPIGPPPGGEDCIQDSLEQAMNNLRAAGIFMAVAAGNYGPSCSTIVDPPAIYDSAVTVGATDSNDNIMGFSSRGPSTVNSIPLRKPDLSAPGYIVRSSVPPNYYLDYYADMYGTSMAAPHVAGAVALLWSAFPPLRGDVDLTESILEQSAAPRTTSQLCSDDGQVPNNVYGYGRIDVYAAYQQALDQIYPIKYYFPQMSK
jgi:subtilisin family serine protease